MLEFDGSLGQCFSRFPTVSQSSVGGGGGGPRKINSTGHTGRVNSHIIHVQTQLVLALHDQLV